MMDVREAIENPVATLRRVMEVLDEQDIDLLYDEGDENGLVDLMLRNQSSYELRELVGYLDPLLGDTTVSEQDLSDLLERCGGGMIEHTARESLAKLASRAHEVIDGKVYRPTRGD